MLCTHFKFLHFLVGEKSNYPYVISKYADEHSLVKFLFIAGKSFKKILDRRVNEFYTWSSLQEMIEQVQYTSHQKIGAYPTHENNENNNNGESKPRNIYIRS